MRFSRRPTCGSKCRAVGKSPMCIIHRRPSPRISSVRRENSVRMETLRPDLQGQSRTRFRGNVATSTLRIDRKSTRLNSSHMSISYAVFCLKKKKYKYIYVSHTENIHSIIKYHI